MRIDPLPARHVHLDFHTSEHIPAVGARFSKKQFQQALKLGKVNHITIFAKCHHSWAYYPTKAGRMHPTLKFDLMGAQIEACHEIGVRCPVYITVGWSATDAEEHPAWVCRNLDGSLYTMNYDPAAKPTDKKPNCSWKNLCVNTAYRDLILAQTREVCDAYDIDGIFYDICFFPRCYCPKCRGEMEARGLKLDNSPESLRAATDYYTGVWQRFFADCNRIIHARHPGASSFFNGRANMDTPKELLDLQTHYELEDLPTTWGGYDKFPPRAKFFINRDDPPKQMLAMSGKFHTVWGEFGGFKHPDAIRFEAASMLAYGAVVSFGDQLHPSGEMDLGTYRNIGQAYKYVQQIERYALPGRPMSNLGLYLTGVRSLERKLTPNDQGVANMLMEAQLDFEIVQAHRSDGDLSRYDTIILTGDAGLNEADAAKLQAYVAQGGKLLVLAQSILSPDKSRTVLDVGAKYLGPANYELDYLVVGKELNKGLCPPDSPFLNYTAAIRVAPASKQAQVLAAIKEPFFNRTYGQYCSHMNTCNRLEDAPHVGALQQGRMIYLAHALGDLYYHHGARIHRDYFLNALRRLYKKPTLETQLPSAGRVNLVHQPEQKRYCVHLMYGPPLQRGRCLIIEDLPELRDIPVTLRVPEKVKRAYLPVSKKKLMLRRGRDGVSLTLPRMQCHEVIVLDY